MNRRKWISLTGGGLVAAGAVGYGFSDRKNIVRADLADSLQNPATLMPAEWAILALASLAPSGHNTQPWFVKRMEPWNWIIGNDTTRWLPAGDPNQRETILSIGAFLQNLEYAASAYGYLCQWELLADKAQDEQIMSVKLFSKATAPAFDISKISIRRTMRSGYVRTPLSREDLTFLLSGETSYIHHLPVGSKESESISQQTLEANRIQSWRDPAQKELADWIRFSSRDAARNRDGLTTASMEIEGIPGWVLRNTYGRKKVMEKSFRQQNINNVHQQIAELAGWFLICSKDDSVASLLETGRRMQRLFLKVRERNIALHPMTQILEEPASRQAFSQSIGIGQPVQFILRTGYVKNYPPPVSLRRPVEWFLRR
jgi:nitroreductase